MSRHVRVSHLLMSSFRCVVTHAQCVNVKAKWKGRTVAVAYYESHSFQADVNAAYYLCKSGVKFTAFSVSLRIGKKGQKVKTWRGRAVPSPTRRAIALTPIFIVRIFPTSTEKVSVLTRLMVKLLTLPKWVFAV